MTTRAKPYQLSTQSSCKDVILANNMSRGCQQPVRQSSGDQASCEYLLLLLLLLMGLCLQSWRKQPLEASPSPPAWQAHMQRSR